MARSKEETNKYIRHWHNEKRDEVYRYKESVPCADCGNFFPHYVMDFDHVRGEKEFNISSLISSRGTRKRIWDEIAKCDVVCANCHRIRTYKEKSVYGKNC